MKYKCTQTISAGSCDPNGRLSLLGGLVLMEDVVTVALDKMQINGFNMRRKFGAVLVFSKNHVQFLQQIAWNEKVKITCFISAKSAARLSVDVCVKNARGLAMYGRTEVCAVDVTAGRIRRLDAVGIGQGIKVFEPLHAMEWSPIEPAQNLVENVVVRTGNIDYAGHTNNVEYIRLLLNTFTLEEWRGDIVPKEIQVAYISQSFLGNNLAIYSQDNKVADTSLNQRLFTIKKDDKDVLRCVIRW